MDGHTHIVSQRGDKDRRSTEPGLAIHCTPSRTHRSLASKEAGMMSSLIGDRAISRAIGCSLMVSLVSAINQGMVSKSFAVKSLSPLALILHNVSSISVRNRSWN